jgi:hypothetical protein
MKQHRGRRGIGDLANARSGWPRGRLDVGGRDHILRRHADIADRLDEVRTVVAQADFITQDSDYARREIHYRRTRSGQGWMRVVVNYRPIPPQGTWSGEVITAFRVNQRDVQKVQLWP